MFDDDDLAGAFDGEHFAWVRFLAPLDLAPEAFLSLWRYALAEEQRARSVLKTALDLKR
jgi:hypothetical protein